MKRLNELLESIRKDQHSYGWTQLCSANTLQDTTIRVDEEPSQSHQYWTVRLKNVLPDTTMAEIIAATTVEYDIPQAIDLSELEDEDLAADHEMIPAYVRSLPTQIGSCYFTDSRDTGNGGWAKVNVRSTKNATRDAQYRG